MHRNSARRSLAVVSLAAFLALTASPSPAAAAGFAGVPGWEALASAWAWLADLGGLPHLRGELGSFIDPNGRPLVAPPNGSASSRGLTHLQGGLGSFIDPDGKPQNAPPSGQAGSFIDPNGRP